MLRQFNIYLNRSAVMAEGLKGYMDLVNERLDTIKTEVLKLQRAGHYAETIKDFKPSVMEEVPEELQNSWIDELTIRTFNEELKNVFPYINRLVSEKNKIQEVGPSDMGMNKYGLAAKHKDGKSWNISHDIWGYWSNYADPLPTFNVTYQIKGEDKKELNRNPLPRSVRA